MSPAIILPELKGMPILLTKNNSEALKNESVYGNKNLKTNAKYQHGGYISNDEFFRSDIIISFIEVNKY